MGKEIVQDTYGVWEISWPLISSIVSGYCVSKAQVQHGHTKIEKLGWFLPDVITHEIDWNKANPAIKHDHQDTMNYIRQNIDSSVPEIKNLLQQLIRDTSQNRETYRKRVNAASGRSDSQMKSYIQNYQKAIEWAKVVRDSSADLILLGATFASGGTALALMGAGSLAKGLIEYSDSKNMGAALLVTTGSVITTMIPIGRGATGAAETMTEKGVLLFFEASFESSKHLVNGKSVEESILNGSVKAIHGATSHALGEVMKLPATKKLIPKLGLPADVYVEGLGQSLPVNQVMGEAGSIVVNNATGQAMGVYIEDLTHKRTIREKLTNANQLSPSACMGSEVECAQIIILDQAVKEVVWECRLPNQ